MHSTIAGYEWPFDGTIQVVYHGHDTHIHEIAAGPEGTWRDHDLTRVAGGPILETPILTAYVWPQGRTRQINYTSLMGDGHIHELVMLQGHAWAYEDIMKQVPGAPPSDGMGLTGYAWKAGGSKHVAYTAPDSRIYEVSTGTTGPWSLTDLIQAADAVPAGSRMLVGYAWDAQGTRQLVFISSDGRLHEFMMGTEGRWSHRDLTQATGTPPARLSSLAGFAWEGGRTKQVVYRGTDGDLYELVAGTANQWSATNLNRVTGAPLPAGSALAGFAWETGQSKQVMYVGRDRHVHELSLAQRGHWKHTDLTQYLHAPEASDDVMLGQEWQAQFAKQVVYLDMARNPHLHSLLLRHGEDWNHTDLMEFTGAPALV